MNQIPLKNQIIEWSKSQDYWFQYAANRFLEGEELSEELIERTYVLFKEDNELQPQVEPERPEILFNEIHTTEGDEQSLLRITELENIKNVNALAQNQTLPLNQNLTIIYGDNGAGKSGYIRLLNNAFLSRGDKEIIPNVFLDDGEGENPPECDFKFKVGENPPYLINYPSQKSSSEFSQFSVFDSKSSRAHVGSDNQLDFTPIGFEFFDKVTALYSELESLLNSEIKKNCSENIFLDHFQNENIYNDKITNLSNESDLKELKTLSLFTEEHDSEKTELLEKKEKLNASHISKRTAELKQFESNLEELVTRIRPMLVLLKKEYIDALKLEIESIPNLKKLASAEGIDSLKEYEISKLGTPEWIEFLKKAQNYANLISENYPDEEDKCLFCLQPLQKAQIDLINSYWALIKGESRTKIDTLNTKIENQYRDVSSLKNIIFDETTALFLYVQNIDLELSETLKNDISVLITSIDNLKENLQKKSWKIPVLPSSLEIERLEGVKDSIKKELDELVKKNSTEELKTLQNKLNLIEDRKKLSLFFQQIEKYVNQLKWAQRAKNKSSNLRTNAVSTKQKSFFDEHITEAYRSNFENECRCLGAPESVDISQRSQRATTLRRMKIRGMPADNILSEGEQRAISLADFLTETKLNPRNKGLILDDPVSSQDHERRLKISSRLVKLAQEKQVVVFTHDIVFFLALKKYAENNGLSYDCTTIRKSSDTPGFIDSMLPWKVRNVKRRIGKLKQELQKLDALERAGKDDDYLILLTGWYGFLRETWERSVEERLFKGVVERFSPGIETMRLKKVVVTEELINSINDGMSNSSEWLHDNAAGKNPPIPNTTDLQKELDKIIEFELVCSDQ